MGWTQQPLRVPEVHHVIKRAPGGSDFELDRLVALCPPCHAQTDAPYARGRLVVMPCGGGRFIIELWKGTGKETSQVVERCERAWVRWVLRPLRGSHGPRWRPSMRSEGADRHRWPARIKSQSLRTRRSCFAKRSQAASSTSGCQHVVNRAPGGLGLRPRPAGRALRPLRAHPARRRTLRRRSPPRNRQMGAAGQSPGPAGVRSQGRDRTGVSGVLRWLPLGGPAGCPLAEFAEVLKCLSEW